MTDSIGNRLPKGVFLQSNEGLGEALKVNTFLLAAAAAIKSGNIVIYNQQTKSAAITDKNGCVSYISH